MSIYSIKEQEVPDTPLLLFECTLTDGIVERWCTHQVNIDGQVFEARVLSHNSFDLRSGSDDGIDGVSRVSLTLSNPDSHFSQIERTLGFKGARLTVQFLFYDLKTKQPTTSPFILFQGIANPPEECSESRFRLSFNSRLNLQRVLLPSIRIQRRCPWIFPLDADQRAEAKDGGENGSYSNFFRCGYSADQEGGVGNLNGAVPFVSCDFTRVQCEERGMFSKDHANRNTGHFGGIEFVPASTLVRTYGASSRHLSGAVENTTRYNDFVPMVYGTAWYEPPVVFARNDGNLTRMEVLLGVGPIEGVIKILVNGIEIPIGQDGKNMTSTGWYNMINYGYRSGGFNQDFSDSQGNPLGDPYGSMAYLSLVVPNRISDGKALPKVEVLLQGLKLPIYSEAGVRIEESFTNNPAWVILDVLRRTGWMPSELNFASFARAALFGSTSIATQDLYGNSVSIPRYECNLVLRRRMSAADLIRGIRNGSQLILTYGEGGKLELRIENTIAIQQPGKAPGSNSTGAVTNGWPVYEFSDGSRSFGGILRKENGESTVVVFSRSTADTANRMTLEFQDSFNDYQQDSVSLVDSEDVLVAGQEITASVNALGIGNFDQALRVARLSLNKSIYGNLFIEFETSMKGLGIRPGDLISFTYLKEGFERQLFRVIRISPKTNYRTALITAQIHEEDWYSLAGQHQGGRRRRGRSEIGIPRPIGGVELDGEGRSQFRVTESSIPQTDGGELVNLTVEFSAPKLSTKSAAGIPFISFSADVLSSGGTLESGQELYYAISALDAEGAESELSFTIRASIPDGSALYSVRLKNLSFDEKAVAFCVYRGTNPLQMTQIADHQPIAQQFIDGGLPTQPDIPADPSYDHANFYWRTEFLPTIDANIVSPYTIGNSTLSMMDGENQGAMVRITQGKGEGQERHIVGNDSTILMVQPAWDIIPDSTSKFSIAESSWKFGGLSQTDRVGFSVPNRKNATIQISGRSANIRNEECPPELSPLTRWRIGGASGASLDSEASDVPAFGLFPVGNGTVELVSVSFADLENTRSVAGGTLILHYWDEFNSPTPFFTVSSTGENDEWISLNQEGIAVPGSLIQLDGEILRVEAKTEDGGQYRVTRGLFETLPEDHPAGTSLYHLQHKTMVIPFVRDFFGSPSSGSFSYRILLPNIRIAAAEFYVTNSHGNSPVGARAYTFNLDRGIRTLNGGQMDLQMNGYLAIQSDAVPPLVTSSQRAVRDVFAIVHEPPRGGDIQIQVLVDGMLYCDLKIDDGEILSNVVDGFGKPALAEKSIVSLDVISVPASGAGTPGRDLSVTLRC